jgi:hypothetical protein
VKFIPQTNCNPWAVSVRDWLSDQLKKPDLDMEKIVVDESDIENTDDALVKDVWGIYVNFKQSFRAFPSIVKFLNR